jgi:hypothetical protein
MSNDKAKEAESELKDVRALIASYGHQARTARGAPGWAIFDGRDKCVAGCPGYTMTIEDLKAWVKEQQEADSSPKEDEET